jgi:hypothetical protein
LASQWELLLQLKVVVRSRSGISPNLTDQLGFVTLNFFFPRIILQILGFGDATTVSGQFLDVADAIPRRSSQQVQFIKFHQNFAKHFFLTKIVRRIIWKNKDIKEPNLVTTYLTLAARPSV